MRRPLLLLTTALIVSLALAIPVGAQEGPLQGGSILLGGSFAFNSDGGDLFENAAGDRITRISFSPNVAFFIADGVGLGLNLAYSRTSQGSVSSTQFGAGPCLYYFPGGGSASSSVRGATLPYLRGIALFSVQTSDNGVTEATWNGTLFEIGDGFVHMLSEHAGLNVSAGYQLLSYKDDADVTEDGNRIRLGLGLLVFLY